MGASSLNITPEREESVDFSDPYSAFGVVLVTKGSEKQTFTTLKDLENVTLGIVTGTSWDIVAQRNFPNAERKYYTSSADVVLALERGKIDAFFADKTVYAGVRWENNFITCIDEPIEMLSNALIFAKDGYDENLLAQINAFIAKSKSDGTLDFLSEKWFGASEPKEHPDYIGLTGENGTLKIAIGDSMKPLAYQRGSLYTGYDVDFLTLFAKEYGYKLDMYGMAFDALIPSVTSGKCDIGACGITITPERAESVMFSDPHIETYGVAVIKNNAVEDSSSQLSFWDNVKESFHKTFIREDRWKLIVEGIGITMLISVCSALAGSIFGFGLYILSRSDIKAIQKLAKGFAKGYSRIIEGTPIIVILMILFYVVFGNIRDMSGIVVAVIGFALTFGAFVYDHMTVSVGSVDRGQTEAAYALGYTKNRTFFRIIFPQAMRIFLPSYCGQAVELIKATAVVGYIAVNDLTKMGDIIRSNTYEAFFPLIATAAIYFLLTWVCSLLLGLIKLRFEPKRRSKEAILKGVKIK
jgi:polar amino acid transport system substrate-binding protein